MIKFYKGKKKLARKMNPLVFWCDKDEKKFIKNLMVGDLISSHTGFNSRVESLEERYLISETGKTKVIEYLIIKTEDGFLNYWPKSDIRPKDKKQIIEWIKCYRDSESLLKSAIENEWDLILKSVNKLNKGEDICDENGIII